jgi:simple sugar transport system permease protein
MNNNKASPHIKREPIARMVKRPDMSGRKTALLYLVAIFVAIAAGGVFILALGHNPINYYATVISGSFRSNLSTRALIRITIPLLITSLGLAVSFRMKFWNIGAEGQFIFGAVCASYVALFKSEGLPHSVVIILMGLAGFVGGGLFGLIAAFFKTKFGTSETLLTLMLNYVALYLVQYLMDGPWRDPESAGFSKIAQFPETAWVDQIAKVDVSWIIALALVIFLFIYFKYTKHGYEISVVGDSQNTARYAGMNVSKIVLRTMFLSAGICGLAGMLQVAGDATTHTLSTGIASGVGFTAIIVAWLAKLNPFGIVAVSCMFGLLDKGCGVAESTFNLSGSVADILQGIILFFILAFDFFIQYKLAFKKAEKTAGGADN